jgi:hypothetical protein
MKVSVVDCMIPKVPNNTNHDNVLTIINVTIPILQSQE